MSGTNEYRSENYRDVFIEFNFYRNGEYSIQYLGDDYIFDNLAQAKHFVDTVIYGEEVVW